MTADSVVISIREYAVHTVIAAWRICSIVIWLQKQMDEYDLIVFDFLLIRLFWPVLGKWKTVPLLNTRYPPYLKYKNLLFFHSQSNSFQIYFLTNKWFKANQITNKLAFFKTTNSLRLHTRKTSRKISGSIPGSSSLYVQVSLGKILNSKLLLKAVPISVWVCLCEWLETCMAVSAIRVWMCVSGM